MAYLDVSPMIAALRQQPEDFEQKGRWLIHRSSRHSFRFDSEGHVRLRASCECAALGVERRQGQELWRAYQLWHEAYWRPILINRQFALHFRRSTLWRRLLRAVFARLDKGRSPQSAGLFVLHKSVPVHGRAELRPRR